VTLTKLDKVAEADFNWMVTERSDSQFAGLVNSWTGRCVHRFVKSRNAVFKIAFILSVRANFPLHFSTLVREL